MFYVYILKSESDDYYLGYSSDLRRRLEEHNNGSSKSTQGKIWEVVYYEAYKTKEAAIKREISLKKNRRMKTLLLNRIKMT